MTERLELLTRNNANIRVTINEGRVWLSFDTQDDAIVFEANDLFSAPSCDAFSHKVLRQWIDERLAQAKTQQSLKL